VSQTGPMRLRAASKCDCCNKAQKIFQIDMKSSEAVILM
jgi:hypothetical protein